MKSAALSLLDRVGSALTGHGSLYDRVRRETTLDRLSELLPYRLWLEEEGLYVGARSTGFVLELVPFLGSDDTLTGVLSEVLSDGMPDGAEVQIMNWASPRVGPMLERWALARCGDGDVLERLALHRSEHLKRGAFESLSAHAPFYLRQFRVFLSIGLQRDASDETCDTLKALRDSILQALRSVGVGARDLQPDGLIRHLDDVLNPRRATGKSDAAYDPAVLIDRQIVRSDTSVTLEPGRILFETVSAADRSSFAAAGPEGLKPYRTDRFDLRAFSARKFPGEFDQGAMSEAIGSLLNAQLRLPCPTLSCLAISFGRKETDGDYVSAKFNRAEQQAGTTLARWMPEIAAKAEDWKWVRARVREGARLVKAGYFVCAFASESEADTAERAVRSIYRAMGWELTKDLFVASQTLAACLPLTLADGLGEDLKKLRRLRHMVTDSCVQLAPFQGEYLGSNRADLLLVGRRGQPFFWSPFSNVGEGNHNVSIIGASGSGKSVLMQELVTGLLGGDALVTVIDDGENFKHMCEALGGTHVKFTLQADICLNPFSLLDETRAAKDADYRADSLGLVRAMVEQMAKGEERASAEERGLIDGAVAEVWKTHGAKAGVDEVARALKAQGAKGEALANALKPYTSAGLHGGFFNGEASLGIDARLTVFEMKDLDGKRQLRDVVMLALMFIINQRMMRDRSEKMALVIDEAWALLGEGAAGEFIAGFARRCRKYGGAIITGTQGIDDYYKTEGARAAFENSDWAITLRVKSEAVDAMRKSERLNITDYTADLIRSLQVSKGEYSELLIMGPHGQHVGRLVLDPFSATLFSSDAQVFAEIERLEAAGLSPEAAVEAVAFGHPQPREASHVAQ